MSTVRYENVPLLNDEQGERLIRGLQPPTADAFEAMLAIASPNRGRLFSVLADGTAYPLVFHCGAGIHRTGLAAALVLGAIGVADDDIVEDYTLSDDNMESFIEHRRAEGRLSYGSVGVAFSRLLSAYPTL